MSAIESAMDVETIENELRSREWMYHDDTFSVETNESDVDLYPTGVRIVVYFKHCVSSEQMGVFSDPVFEAVSVHERRNGVAVHLTPVF